MTTKTQDGLTINVSPDLCDVLKFQADAHGKTLTDFVLDTLMEGILKDSVVEDKIWAEMSASAKKESSLSTEASERLLNRMKNA